MSARGTIPADYLAACPASGLAPGCAPPPGTPRWPALLAALLATAALLRARGMEDRVGLIGTLASVTMAALASAPTAAAALEESGLDEAFILTTSALFVAATARERRF